MQQSKGVTIVGFTKQQVANYNQVKLEAAEITIEVSDYFHPNEYSIEEAVVIQTSDSQKHYKAGDGVLIDFAVFTAGKHSQFEGNTESRYVGSTDQYDLYWVKDPEHAFDTSEVYATIDGAGNVQPIGDVIVIERKEKDDYKQQGSVLLPTDLITGEPFRAIVSAVPVGCELSPGTEIWCEAGYSPVIKYRGKHLLYINYPYIIGSFVDNQLHLL